MDDANRRWRCQACNVIHLGKDLLKAPNPFDPSEDLTGCPHCKSAEQFVDICDEPGCTRPTSCGFPAGPEYGGYRRTCSEHYKAWSNERAAAIQENNGG